MYIPVYQYKRLSDNKCLDFSLSHRYHKLLLCTMHTFSTMLCGHTFLSPASDTNNFFSLCK